MRWRLGEREIEREGENGTLRWREICGDREGRHIEIDLDRETETHIARQRDRDTHIEIERHVEIERCRDIK